MLRGAVTFGEDFEENYMKQIFDLRKGMTQAISHFSRYEDANAIAESGKYVYTGANRKDALTKIRQFYHFSILVLVGVAVILFTFTADFSHPSDTSPSAPTSAGERAAPHGQ
jgi:hypothetical protein